MSSSRWCKYMYESESCVYPFSAFTFMGAGAHVCLKTLTSQLKNIRYTTPYPCMGLKTKEATSQLLNFLRLFVSLGLYFPNVCAYVDRKKQRLLLFSKRGVFSVLLFFPLTSPTFFSFFFLSLQSLVLNSSEDVGDGSGSASDLLAHAPPQSLGTSSSSSSTPATSIAARALTGKKKRSRKRRRRTNIFVSISSSI